ncbi:hypothetical protein [Streptomyces rugosispiralis]|uniref:site-specific DNA-methyltransferase (cytosine-N(4)-specific) n=1 Tax=Streptomyces rugosispiralis TaxID=2967341 RepID=A0ABT1UZS4_9ACTN|nr:hypothetical protein [Streptomyces rugosispiralis]MCQ8190623.1 hypothetical protein [Streptomyces rugosispiralis]
MTTNASAPTQVTERRTVDVPGRSPILSALQEALPLPVHDGGNGNGARRVLSPKRPAVETAGLADAFPYYAGFSFDWATSCISNTQLKGVLTVLDPWNGSGTTTLAANTLGHSVVGLDRNPVASVVAQLRCKVPMNVEPIRFSSLRIRASARTQNDPLNYWFDDITTARIRAWTSHLEHASPSNRTMGLVAAFRAVRSLTKHFEGSNPTWVKRASENEERLCFTHSEIDEAFFSEQVFLASRLSSVPRTSASVSLLTADSAALPLATNSIDIIVTSPPYLTRIDYAVAYARELAVLGIDVFSEKTLRKALMGTTLTRQASMTPSLLGPMAEALLSDISQHASKASSSYYMKQAKQYLNDLNSGLRESARVSKPGAEMHLVVQDSYYKDVLVPLAEICIEEAKRYGWELQEHEMFPVKRLLTTLNTSARAYKKGDVSESVITFTRRKHD